MNERILCAAIWFKEIIPRAVHRPINTPGGVVLCGFRHGDIISQLLPLNNKKLHELGIHVQGFLTSENRFVDRKEGAILFVNCGGKLNYSTKELYSEDLY